MAWMIAVCPVWPVFHTSHGPGFFYQNMGYSYFRCATSWNLLEVAKMIVAYWRLWHSGGCISLPRDSLCWPRGGECTGLGVFALNKVLIANFLRISTTKVVPKYACCCCPSIIFSQPLRPSLLSRAHRLWQSNYCLSNRE